MSRSFHVTRKRFSKCTNKELSEMIEDEYSDFNEWVYKSNVKKTVKAKRQFEKVFVELMKNENLSAEEIEKLDDREYYHHVLRNKMSKNV